MGTRPYDFHKLHSETEFEQLVALVARKLIGQVIQFKQGPDGGRDARFDGRALDWPNANGLEGKFVLQAKHTHSETGDCRPNEFKRLVRGEYAKIKRLVENGVCEYYLFFSTWQLPGGVDEELIREIEEELGVKKAAIIARETLERIVDENPGIQNWVYEHTERSRARSSQRWGRLLGILREQEARTRSLVGFMNDAFANASHAANDLVIPQFTVSGSSGQMEQVIDLRGLIDRLGSTQAPIVIEGPVGAGKSAAAKMLVQARVPDGDQIADGYDQNSHWLPLYVTGKDIQQSWNRFIDLLDHATNKTDHMNWRVVVDGLDEIENADLRARLTDYAFSNLHPQNAKLGFIFFSRPGVVDVPEGRSVTTLRVQGFDRERQLQTALLFCEGEQQAEDLISKLEGSLAEEMLERPLFLALAVYLATEGYGDINSRYELLDFFVDDVVKRASEKSGCSESYMLRELSELAVGTELSLGPKRLRGAAAVNAAKERQQTLIASGLVRRLNTSIQFSHEIFSSFFRARYLAEKFTPSRTVWEEVDPFHWGWDTVSLLCECWDTLEHELSECLKALSRLSKEGLERATELAATCQNVSEETRYDFAVQIINICEYDGVAPVEVRKLSRLGLASAHVRDFLEDIAVIGSQGLFDARVLAACSVASFDAPMGQNLLYAIALDVEMGWIARVSAAQELIGLGGHTQAIEAFRAISIDGDEFQGRFEGAVSALELTDDPKDRARLGEVIAEFKREDIAFHDTLGRAAALRFTAFSIPLMQAPIEEALAKDEGNFPYRRPDLQSALWSCETLASIGVREDALRYYLQLLELNGLRSRTMADVLSSMDKAGFRQKVEEWLHSPENLAKLRYEPDRFTIEFLEAHGLAENSAEDVLDLLRATISDRSELYSCLGYADSLVANGQRDDVLDVLRSVPVSKLLPRHFEIQARCGERQLARENLLKGLRTWDTQDKIWSAEVLENIGFANDAARVLLGEAQCADLLLTDRLKAALKAHQMDRLHLSVVEDCLKEARYDDLLYASLVQKLLGHGDAATELAWQLISGELAGGDLSDECRFEFANALRYAPVPIDYEAEWEDLHDEMITLLANVSDPWLFARCASAFSSNYANGYINSIIIDRLRRDSDLWSADLLRGVCNIKEIAAPLEQEIVKFACSVRCDWLTAIDALQNLAEASPGGAAEKKLHELIRDGDVPLQWRLAAIGIEWNQSRNSDVALFQRAFSSQQNWLNQAEKHEYIVDFCKDARLTVECRLALIKQLKDEARSELLFRLAREVLECSVSTKIDLAQELARYSFEVEANQIVNEIISSGPLSFWEAEKLLELCDELGREDAIHPICVGFSETPEIVLEWLEDTSSVGAIAVRIADVLGRDQALRVLRVLAEKNQYARWEDETLRAAFLAIGAPDELKFQRASLNRGFLFADRVDWDRFYDATRRIDQGDTSELTAFVEVLSAVSVPLNAKTRALEVLFKAPSDFFSDQAFEAALQDHLGAALVSETSNDDLIELCRLLIAVRKLSGLERVLEPLLEAGMRPSETIKLAKLLDEISRKTLSRSKLEQLQTFDGYLDLGDFLYVQNTLGIDAADERLTCFFGGKEVETWEKLDVASYVACPTGVKSAQAFIGDTRENKNLDCTEALGLAEHYYDAGHLGFARAMYSRALGSVDPDYYWLADFAFRYLGDRKQSGEILLSNLDKFEPMYFDQVCRLLADLGLDGALENLAQMKTDPETA